MGTTLNRCFASLPKSSFSPNLILRRYITTLLLAFILPLAMLAQETEEQLRTEAEALFEAENYKDAFNKYSQLLSLKLEDPEYNFRFGACQLFTSHDKEQALKYLKFAVETPNAPNLSHFYYGLGLHLNYRFEKAIKEYEKYQAEASKKEKENQLVSHYIEQCRSGIDLVSSFTDISVVQREALPLSDFYRNYDLSEFGGKIMVKPEDFMSEEDKKRDAKFLMYFQQNADYVYYSSYSEKNATGKDLFVIQKLPTGEWSKATQLSSVVNTPYDEDYPFIHPDGDVLYFASKGHNSMGGYDIFKSTRRGDGTWTKPKNMEFAINTPWDDFLFISDKAEKTAWFASNRETNSSQVVVYKIGIDRVPLDLTLIKGTFEAEGSKKAKITIEDVVQNNVIGVYDSERQFGEYLLDLKGSGNYKFIVEAEESNAVHTGLVEVPREKGLKQFRQEMKLVNVNGKEQLQIINHFDEPLEDETLLTAEILKKQASLNVNSSEDEIAPTTEILDDQTDKPIAADNGMSQEEKLSKAENQIKELEGDAQLLNQKAALLADLAKTKSTSSTSEEIAEAAIAAELANDYKKEADIRSAAAAKMNDTYEVLDNGGLEESAFNAQYNQMSASGQNFKPLDDFETKLKSSYAERVAPSEAIYKAKEAEHKEIQDDITGINEEISYLTSELENTKDDALKEEYRFQIEEAKSAKPAKEVELKRAKAELDVASKQQANATNYASITANLFETASAGAESFTSATSAAAISELQSTLGAKAATDPALLAFVAPELAAEATANALAESRKNRGITDDELDTVQEESDAGGASNDKEDTETVDGFDDFMGSSDSETDSNDESAANEFMGAESSPENNDDESTVQIEDKDESRLPPAIGDELLYDENGEVVYQADPTSNDNSIENSPSTESDALTDNSAEDASNGADSFFGDDQEEIDNSASGTAVNTDGTAQSSAQENAELNEEIRTISAAESKPEIISGNYNEKLQAELAEAANAEDPVIAESRKAEIYDQWVQNIDYRIDSLTTAQSEVNDTKSKLEFANQIAILEDDKAEKDELAMASYAAIAELSDQQAQLSVSNNNQPNGSSETSTQSETVETADGADSFMSTDDTSSDGAEEFFNDTDESNGASDFMGGGELSESNENDASSFMGDDASVESLDNQESTDADTESQASQIRTLNPDSIPPVTPEILNSETVPPTVIALNSSYTQQLQGAKALPTAVEQKKEQARINKAWANDLAFELQVLSTQMESLDSPEQRTKLNELAANVASQRTEKQNKSAELQKAIIVAEKEALVVDDKKQLQQQLNQYVDTYNSSAFIQLEDQVNAETNPELKKTKTEVLNQNWMVALKNEELKTETRIANSTDPAQKAELEEKLVQIAAEKLYVQSTLDSIKASELEGPSVPKAVVVKGSEKFEGYIPVATGKTEEYDEKTQISFNKVDRINSQIAETQGQLDATKKKKQRAPLELKKAELESDLEVAQLESDYYQAAEPKIIGVEPLILQLESGDPTPSQIQMNEAQNLETEAAELTESARIQREAADLIKKKKVRIPAQQAAKEAEQLALLKRKEATLAGQLANEMADIEARAIANNFIIPAGQEITLPVVSNALNPTEQADVASTEQFAVYNQQKRQADSLRNMSLKLISVENQLNNRAQGLLTQSSLDPEVRLRTAAEAYMLYDKADSLSSEAARLNRQAAFIENNANQELLKNPEEVYNSIIAYYNTDTIQRPSEPTDAEIASLTNIGSNQVETEVFEESDQGQPNQTPQEQFDLTPPRQSNQSVAVQSDVLTNTIFEADPNAGSYYGPTTPIPVDPPLPPGVIYKVQIGAFRNAIKQDAFKGIKPITGESTGTGLTRYSAGAFTNFTEADLAKDEIRGIGYRDAFVVAYRDGKRVGSGGSVASSGSGTASAGTNTTRPVNSTASNSSSGFNSLPANSVIKQGSLVVQDVKNQPGTFYTVQVGVFSKPVTSKDIANITPLNQENLSNGTYRYTTGIFKEESIAEQAKNEIRSIGISDAFVTAYKSGNRVTVDAARQDLGGNGVSTSSGYRVFLGKFSGEVPLAQATVILGLSSNGLDKVKNADGSSSYYFGNFSDQGQAESEATKFINQGLTQAKAQKK